jgi:hypothetical protein
MAKVIKRVKAEVAVLVLKAKLAVAKLRVKIGM